MRSVGLDLGARHIAFCEVVDGVVIRSGSVRRLSELRPMLGPESQPARVAFEACREGWHVHETLQSWQKVPLMLDTTRVRQIGVGEHRRKNDAIDARAIAMALDAGRVPLAHVLSPHRRELRALLSVRGELVELRARQVVIIRGLARAKGVLIRSCATRSFVKRLAETSLEVETRDLVAPLVATLCAAEAELERVDAKVAAFATADPIITLCTTAPGVGVIVAATFVSVIDEAKRFRNAHAVAAYLGLVPGENTTGGPGKRRLGSITKHGNTHARAMLVQSAWQIMRSANTADPLRRWADELASKRGNKVAAVALARKLAGVLWAMWRDGTVYDAAFAAHQTSTGWRAEAQRREVVADAMVRAARKIRSRDPKKKQSSRRSTQKTSTEVRM